MVQLQDFIHIADTGGVNLDLNHKGVRLLAKT
jgi:hypothetical protein